MAVIVTRKPGGVTQLFNTDTGRITYKCKAESAYMPIEAFGGIVKFCSKGATATVTGHVTEIESCDVIKKEDPRYRDALLSVIASYKEFAGESSETYQKEIEGLESELS